MVKKQIKKFAGLFAIALACLTAGFDSAQITGASPTDTNLVAYLRLNEISGQTANDSSTYDNDGTLGSTTGVDVNDPSWTAGKYGNALDFDGADDADDYVNLGNAPELNNQGPLTWETWIYPRSTGEGLEDNPRGRIIDKGTKRFFVEDDGSRNIGFGVDGDGLTYRTTTNNAFNLNEWSHVVLTWDGTNDHTKIRIYVNGIESTYIDGADGNNPDDDSAYGMIIGNTIGTDHAFDGKIDEVKIYDRVLSADEVLESYACITNLRARAKSGKVQLKWTHIPGADHYEIYRRIESGGSYSEIPGIISTRSTYLDKNVINGETYYYVLRRVTGDDFCVSNEVSATPVAKIK